MCLLGNQVLIPKGLEKYYSRSVFYGLFINLGLNVLLIPGYASLGAAAATLATECSNMIYMGLHCKEEAFFLKKNINAFKYFFALLGAIGAELTLKYSGLTFDSLFVRLSINVMGMTAAYWALLLLLKEPLLADAVQKILSIAKHIRRK